VILQATYEPGATEAPTLLKRASSAWSHIADANSPACKEFLAAPTSLAVFSREQRMGTGLRAGSRLLRTNPRGEAALKICRRTRSTVQPAPSNTAGQTQLTYKIAHLHQAAAQVHPAHYPQDGTPTRERHTI
jgi:hypothetical protein